MAILARGIEVGNTVTELFILSRQTFNQGRLFLDLLQQEGKHGMNICHFVHRQSVWEGKIVIVIELGKYIHAYFA